MSIMQDAVTQAIAARIRSERAKRDWSIEDLARHSGVSRAMISKIERAESSPTAVVIARLSGAFDLTMSDLLAAPKLEPKLLVRRAQQQVWNDPGSGYTRRAISPQPDSPLQLVQVELPARVKIGFPSSAYDFLQQQIWVQSGVLHFTEGPRTHVLQRGDCLQLGPPENCVFYNPGGKSCKYLVAVVLRRRQ